MPEPDKRPDKGIAASGQINRDDLNLILTAAREAGQIALQYFGKDPKVWMKQGSSPVSEADHAADKYLYGILRKARPDYGWLSEETTDDFARLACERIFIIDPIDGTRGFIDGKDQWCVSVAVISQGKPICGVLECPALAETYSAIAGGGALLNGQRILAKDISTPQKITGPAPLIAQYEAQTGIRIERQPFIPSLAYRMAMVATGALDGTFARPNSHDWDIAAADLILSESGARLSEKNGEAIRYNGKKITHDILVAGAPEIHENMIAAANRNM